MTAPVDATIKPREIVKALKDHYRLWMVPTILGGTAALLFGLVRAPVWQATQGLVVRDEAVSSVQRQGRFDSTEAMKTAQETIAEVARSRAVAAAALSEVGPPADGIVRKTWPTAADLEALQEAITVKAPKGTEFGRTEVLHLAVQGPTRERAIALAEAVGDELEARLKELRNIKAQSLIDELIKAVDIARKDTESATRELETIEREVGPDLGELRTLNDSGAGDSNLRVAFNQVTAELRQAQTVQDTNQQLRALLAAAQRDPDQLVATPNRLLESQPALRRLKEGLVDAQLRVAQLLGKMSEQHPEVRAARSAEQAVRSGLHSELETAIRGLDADLKVSETLIQSLSAQSADIERRLDRLAGLRARYSNLAAEVRHSNETLQKAQNDLADARASLAAAESASLIARLDRPATGECPLGPSVATLTGLGLLGGSAIGLGLVFLIAPFGPIRNQGRRWSDYLRGGRRATDRVAAGRVSGTAMEGDRRVADRRAGSPAPAPAAQQPAAVPPDRRQSATAAPAQTEETKPVYTPLPTLDVSPGYTSSDAL
jgi:uncharacterized protein involved in exopolysaccharide biosynthesis